MLKFIKERKEALTFIALYAGSAVAGGLITYAVMSLKHTPDLYLKNAYEKMLSNPFLDDIRKYGITEVKESPFVIGAPHYAFLMNE